jgi:hypothetical protein
MTAPTCPHDRTALDRNTIRFDADRGCKVGNAICLDCGASMRWYTKTSPGRPAISYDPDEPDGSTFTRRGVQR